MGKITGGRCPKVGFYTPQTASRSRAMWVAEPECDSQAEEYYMARDRMRQPAARGAQQVDSLVGFVVVVAAAL